eukprot:scaffold16214_cov73-Phaeocystis_antarctica.AAC.7
MSSGRMPRKADGMQYAGIARRTAACAAVTSNEPSEVSAMKATSSCASVCGWRCTATTSATEPPKRVRCVSIARAKGARWRGGWLQLSRRVGRRGAAARLYVLFDDVAGAIAAADARQRNELLLRLFGQVEVALRHAGPADHQLTFVTGLHLCHLLVPHREPVVRHGLADRDWLTSKQLGPRRDNRCFGRSVCIEEAPPRLPRVNHMARTRLAAYDDRVHFRQLLGGAQDAQICGCSVEDSDVQRAEGVDQVGAGLHHLGGGADQRGAGGEGEPDLLEGRVERGREALKHLYREQSRR